VPVAGVDRLVLTDQIAVMDLVALGRFLLLPEDDLTLATVLKSPIFALDEEQLFRLAWNRGQASLWSMLAARAGEEPAFARAHELLRQLLARADFTPPYELYAELLGRHGGRRALLARLGPEAADPIDEFLTLALQFERSHVASLQGFLHWLAAGAVEVKRDLDRGAGEVRVMTVHGAKGLEAPIVFLPDTTALPWSAGGLLWQPPEQGGLPLWSPGTEWNEAVVNAAREATRTARMEEYRRLLYVAMTRAEDRLYVCGWRGGRTGGAGNWYDLVAGGLKGQGESFAFDAGAEIGADGWAGEGLRIVGVQRRKAKKKEEPSPPPPPPLPSWAREAAPAEEPTARPLAPSRPPADEPAVLSPLAIGQAPYFRRGQLVHRLLELLPDLAPALRAVACRRFLAQPAHGLAADEAEAMAVEVLRLLDDRRFAALFGPDSLAEAPLAGEIESHDGRRLAVAGRVDRLVVMADRVMVVDYKTGRLAPAEEAATPEAYLWQMATYRALLARIYPDRPVTCCLLWTAGPALQVLSDSRLAALKL
jgi:ATP-dependent helicase/nuclease subunit A